MNPKNKGSFNPTKSVSTKSNVDIRIDIIEDGLPHPLEGSTRLLLTSTAGCASTLFRHNLVKGSLPTSDVARAALALGIKSDDIVSQSSLKLLSKWMDVINYTVRSHYKVSRFYDSGEFTDADTKGRFSFIRAVSEIMYALHSGGDGTLATWGMTVEKFSTGLSAIITAVGGKASFLELVTRFVDPGSPQEVLDIQSITEEVGQMIDKNMMMNAFPGVNFPENVANMRASFIVGISISEQPSDSLENFTDMISSIISYTLTECISNIKNNPEEPVKLASPAGIKILVTLMGEASKMAVVVKEDGTYDIEAIKGSKSGSKAEPSLLIKLINQGITDSTKASSKVLTEVILITNRFTAGLHTMRSYYSDKDKYLSNAFGLPNKLLGAYRSLCSGVSVATTTEMAGMLIASFHVNVNYSASAANMLRIMAEYNSYADPVIVELILDNFDAKYMAEAFNESPAGKFSVLRSDPDTALPPSMSFIGSQMAMTSSYVPSIIFTSKGVLTAIDGIDPMEIMAAAGLSPSADRVITEEISTIFALIINNALCNSEVRQLLTSGTRKMDLSKDYSYSTAIKDDVLNQLRRIEASILIEGAAHRMATEMWILNKLLALRDALEFYIRYDHATRSNLMASLYSEKAFERCTSVLKSLDDVLNTVFGYFPLHMRSHPIAGVLPKVEVNGMQDVVDAFSIMQRSLLNNQGYATMIDFAVTLGTIFKAAVSEGKELSQTTNVQYIKRDYFLPFYPMFLKEDTVEVPNMRDTATRIVMELASGKEVAASAFRNNTTAHLYYAQSIKNTSVDATLPEWKFQSDIATRDGMARRAPAFVGSIVGSIMKDRLTVAMHSDSNNTIRFSKFIRKYGVTMSKLLKIGAGYMEGSYRTYYNTVVSEPRLRQSELLSTILGLIGLSEFSYISEREAQMMSMYVGFMNSKSDTYPLVPLNYVSREKYRINEVIAVSESILDTAEATAIVAFFLRTDAYMSSLFDNTIVIQDPSDSSLLVVDNNDTKVIGASASDHYLTITGTLDIPLYMPIDNTMAQTVGFAIANKMSDLFDEIFDTKGSKAISPETSLEKVETFDELDE